MENINDLIYAYSLGCLDQEDSEKFTPLNDNEIDYKELGEYQNLVALLPIVLSIETPDPLLKDNVAKKLYSLNANKKTVIPSILDPVIEENEPSEKVHISNDNVTDNNAKTIDDQVIEENNPPDQNNNNSFVENTYKSSIENNLKEIENDDAHIIQSEHSNLNSYKEYPPHYLDSSWKATSKLIWGIILFGLLSIGLFIAYMNISSKTNDLNKEVDQLKREVFQLNLKLKSTQEMKDIVQSPNVFTINLISDRLTKSGFGKLFIDSAKGLGYIQLGQISRIPDTKTFHLWAKYIGKIKSLGTFHVPDTGEYYSFNIPNLPYDENINFFITEETANGSLSPGNKIYLQGSYNP